MGNLLQHKAYWFWSIVGFAALGAIAPDLVDKPLWLMGLSDGRQNHEALGLLGIGLAVIGLGAGLTLVGRCKLIRILEEAKE